MGLTPTQRTMKALRDRGQEAGIVERFNPWAGKHGIRQDLFGIIDIIALDPLRGVIGVQSTGIAFSAHMKDFTEDPAKRAACISWLSTPGCSLELWGWRKVQKRLTGGGYSKVKVYEPRVHVFTLDDFGATSSVFD